MNPDIEHLHTYPFEKLRRLLSEVSPASLQHVDMSMGEPTHATPLAIQQAYADGVRELAKYPPTGGAAVLRRSIARWLQRRYALRGICEDRHVLPVNGTREALFSFAQAVIDSTRGYRPIVQMPNPFYQIYEGAALLAKATPYFLNLCPERSYSIDWAEIAQEVWARTQLVFICSPGNPTGNVLSLSQWRSLFDLADRYGFVIAADECYSEIYFDETRPSLGALQAAELLDRADYRQLVVFNSLSKRSNVPGLRSGFVAGDAEILKKFLLYRTYHGSAMSGAVSVASVAAWDDESHVAENRYLYRQKLAAVLPILNEALEVPAPQASFFLWVKTPIDDIAFAKRLYQEQHVTVLPGNYLARNAHGINPGENYVRAALVAPIDQCVEGARRMSRFIRSL
ncbi:succinyldiaminopimelate transaminase [Trinickia dinghuensis]|uniref:Succinyldiaminopimelate transaminase n=1 Tax=Trinickia dinghuensis TaxID=2291023 RepID=A0A3D8K5C8_9BURK|nr:succinyldiaminopimelate transaminase [Trinickia dinghuensis]RDV00648.1 succinyldiaminopimelate transaminase [Trinickia dinghuensis]